jgi:cell division protein FtsZ
MASDVLEDLMDYLPPPNLDKILAVGIGTAGCHILSHLETAGIGVDEYVYVSCDQQDLKAPVAGLRSQMFVDIGFDGKISPSYVRGVAQKHMKEIRSMFTGARLVFLISGLGGSTGSGLTPLLAQLAKEEGTKAVCIVAMPFGFEKSKHFYAGTSLKRVRQNCDAVIVIDNDTISSSGEQMPISKFYTLANDKISSALSGLVSSAGELSIGLNCLVDTVAGEGYTLMSIGESSAINKAEEATTKAVESIYRVGEPEEASRAILYLVGDDTLAASDIATSTSRLNTMLGRSALEIHQGLNATGGGVLTAVLLTSGLKTTKFDDYDPLAKILQDRQLDEEMDCSIIDELSSILAQLE